MPRRLPRLTAAMLVLLAGSARGALSTRAGRRCERAIATVGPRLLDRSMAILAACARTARADCLADAATTRARDHAARTASRRIRRACSAEAAAALRVGGDCADARTPASLAGCIAASHDAEAAAVIDAAGATPGHPSAPARRCENEARRRIRAFTIGRLEILAHCKRHPPADLVPGADCTSAPEVARRVDALALTATRRIGARCAGQGLAGARFGPPCASPATPESLAGCLLAVASAAGDEALATEFPDTGFCGDARERVEQRVDALLAQMTLAEKVEQMHGIGFSPGLSGRTAANERLGIPGIAMIDGPRGVSVVAGHATAFPVGSARGATWDPALEEQVGEAIGSEARARGADMILAPTINILRHPRWGRAQETYGEDTDHLGRMAVAFVRGAERHVIANPKHFAANTIENTRFNVDVSIDERTLREVYLPHFRRAVREGRAAAVMSAYNKVNGHYCSENAHLLHDVLKSDWGFQGFVESDWILGTRSTVPAVTAGLDIEMPAAIFYGQRLADAVGMGRVDGSTIDAAVRRILRAQLCFRLDTDPPRADPTQVETPAHKALARQVAREGLVLLRNRDRVLPLDRATLGSLVVVGGLAAVADLGDHGSSTVVPSSAVTPLDGIRAAAGAAAVTDVPGPTFTPGEQATIAAAGAAIVVVGLTSEDEGEGQITAGDRKMLGLPRDQDALVAAVAALNPRTVVLLEGSGAITMPWVDDVAAILMAWYPGDQGGAAIADVLFGDVVPSGKLPVSFPRAEADLPPFDDVSLAVTYGYYHGYRHLDRNGVAPLFPFGFGLSYTSFRYDNLRVAPAAVSAWGRLRVTADVTNTGAVAGDEVAELYVGYEGSRVDRAVRDLKAFGRVHLEPGETRTVPFDVRAADLGFWDSAAGAFLVEPITYRVEVGSSSRDLPLTGEFSVRP